MFFCFHIYLLFDVTDLENGSILFLFFKGLLVELIDCLLHLTTAAGTLLDGEPIITLPPKFVELKKVDFSDEERDFYSKLEADSRAQFEVRKSHIFLF